MTGQPVSGVVDVVAWTIVAAVAGANIVGPVLMAVDKHRAQVRGRRVPEGNLLAWALLGGWPLMAVAMLAWRHKTRKARFLVRFWVAAMPTMLLGATLVVRLAL